MSAHFLGNSLNKNTARWPSFWRRRCECILYVKEVKPLACKPNKGNTATLHRSNFWKICLPIFSAIVWIRTLLDDPRSEGDDVNVYCMWKRSNHLHVNPTRVTRLLYIEICSCTTAGKSCAVIIHCYLFFLLMLDENTSRLFIGLSKEKYGLLTNHPRDGN